ncbi:MAG TPA: threonine synthase [Chloroflexota bacterium]|jgi:threonine synthase|nr:threonine synthase [Chloroflexota bacterium]
METTAGSQCLIDRYAEQLPVTAATPRITLGEGRTPLVECPRLASTVGVDQLYVKYEGQNPTGSFKDRGMVVAVAKALESGCSSLICASTGNTSASAAAYGAHCGLRTVVIIPRGGIASGKLVQAQIFGADVIAIEGNFDSALACVRQLAETHPVAVVNSINPHRVEGQKTAAFEIVDELGDAPDVIAIPVGNAGNITAYWKGFREHHAAGRCRLPRMVGGQAEGAAPLVEGHPISNPDTVATAIRIGKPASWAGATSARDESGGIIAAVSDQEILAAQRDLARCEGIFCEPASATSIAVIRRLRSENRLPSNIRIVCVLTGNGLKDLDAVMAHLKPPIEVASDAATIGQALGF